MKYSRSISEMFRWNTEKWFKVATEIFLEYLWSITQKVIVDFLKYSSEIFRWNIFRRFRECSIDTCGFWKETGLCRRIFL